MMCTNFSSVKEDTEGDNKQETHFSVAVVIVLLIILLPASVTSLLDLY